MCVDNTPPPPAGLTRRGVLAGAAALAGTSAVLAGAAPEASATSAASLGSPGRGGDLVVEGGRLLDPLTGEVTEDAVVVIVGGVVRAAGPRSRLGTRTPSGVPVLRAHGQWILPGLVDAHIHLNTAAEARDAVLKGATSARSGSTNFYQDVAVRELARQAPERAPGSGPRESSSPRTSATRSSPTRTSRRSPGYAKGCARPRRCAGWSRSTSRAGRTPSRPG